ncbi:SDR family NAD(P)-dependent oxidoreductase [Spirosoma sp. RP8]|uniref:SDR family NAD(P)-dependent oxidoreductase n=1 Tax=Spirosoma liriopis TaxID=2937440 RepID=A0ABT0HR22_9BACT|nr:SDR family NAD(P)-dependent oxidoreductase [Spirosoma liriopis]MCK8494619.1 SDR family NAD(P)-dependent oxidoreductase [Spirosoma liriopis]
MLSVLVTGATSGIGLTIATKLHERGFKVFGTSRFPEKYQQKLPFPLLPLDITSEESVNRCVAAFSARSPVIDVLINNAGMLVSGSAEGTSLDEARQQLDANFWGTVMLTRAILPRMRQQRKGRIITIGSVAGLIGVPFQSYYAASKHAIEGFFKSLRFEVAPFNIDVSVIEPGFFKTNLEQTNEPARSTIPDYEVSQKNALRIFAKSIQKAPTPEPVAEVTLKVIQASRPRFSYHVGSEAKLLPLLQFMSYRFFEWGARRKFKSA